MGGGKKRPAEDRAADFEAKALWARAEAAAARSESVAVLLRCVRGADKINGAARVNVGGTDPLTRARDACAESLKALGVEVPA